MHEKIIINTFIEPLTTKKGIEANSSQQMEKVQLSRCKFTYAMISKNMLGAE